MGIIRKKPILIAILVFLTILAISTTVFAERVFSGWIFEDQTITVSGNTFELRLSQDNTFLFLKSRDVSIAVDAGNCQTESTLKLCFYNATYDRDAKKNKMNIELTENNPIITLLRYANKTSLYQGEKTNISIKMRNAGTYDASSINFEDDLQGFIVTDVTGCSSYQSKVYWTGDLLVNQTKICSYKISAEEVFEKTSKAKITYFDKEEKTVYSDGISFKIIPLFKYDLFARDEIFLGNITRIELNLSAKNNSAPLESLRIKLSKGLMFNQSSTLKRSGEEYVWSGSVDNITSIVFFVQGVYTGYNEITVTGDYLFAGKKESFTQKKKISVKKNDVTISTSLITGDKADELSTKWIKVYVENKNEFTRLKNLKVTIDSPLFEPEKYSLFELNGTQKQMVFYLKKIIPQVTESKTYKFNLNFSYESEFGERFSSILENTLAIVPISKLEMTKELSNTNPRSEDTITITTKIKNPRNKKVENVYIYDDITPLSGINSVMLSLNSSETKTAYVYKIKMPYVRDEKEINITTHISYSEDAKTYDYSYVKTIKVLKKDLKVTFTRKFPDVTRGSVFSTEYEIANPGAEELKNIILVPKKQFEFDIIEETYDIGNLIPGEKIKFNLDAKAKENKTAKYIGETIFFEDNHGTQYEQNLSETIVQVLSFSSDAPIIYLKKDVPSPIKGEKTQINLSIQNTGEAAQILLTDEGHEWIFSLGKNIIKTFSYNKTFYKNGTIKVPEAKAVYDYDGKKIRSYSNGLNVDVKEKITAVAPADTKAQNNPIASNESKKTVLGGKTTSEQNQNSGSQAGNAINQSALDGAAKTATQNSTDSTKDGSVKTGILEKIIAIFKFVFGLS